MNNWIHRWMGAAAGAMALWAVTGTAQPDTVLDTLRAQGLEETQAAPILAIFERGAQEGVPLDSLEVRLQEGLVKQVPESVLLTALRTHLEALIQARRILDAGEGERRRDPAAAECLTVLARALESGLPAEIFSELLARHGHVRLQRLQALVEAAELMHLSGIATDDVQAFLEAGIQRNLRRMETFRAARLWIQKHRAGLDAEAIQSELWPPMAPRDDSPRQRRHQGRRQRNKP